MCMCARAPSTASSLVPISPSLPISNNTTHASSSVDVLSPFSPRRWKPDTSKACTALHATQDPRQPGHTDIMEPTMWISTTYATDRLTLGSYPQDPAWCIITSQEERSVEKHQENR